MKAKVEIKTRINSINDKVLSEEKTILECLNELNISVLEFLIFLGINKDIVNSPYFKEIITELTGILSSRKAIISYNPGMEYFDDMEFVLYDALAHKTVSLWNRRINISTDFTYLGKEIGSTDCVVNSYTIGTESSDKFSYNYHTVYKKEDYKENQNYPLQTMELNVQDESIDKYNIKTRKKFKTTISNGITMEEFMEVIRPLYGHDLDAVHETFLKAECPTKMMEDNFYLKNMNKETNRSPK